MTGFASLHCIVLGFDNTSKVGHPGESDCLLTVTHLTGYGTSETESSLICSG